MSFSGLALIGTFIHNSTNNLKIIFSIILIYFSLVKKSTREKGKANKICLDKLTTSSCKKQKVDLAT